MPLSTSGTPALSLPLSTINNDSAALSTGDVVAAPVPSVEGEEPSAHNLSEVVTRCFDQFDRKPVADFGMCRLVATDFNRGKSWLWLVRSNPMHNPSEIACPYHIRRRGCTLTIDFLPYRPMNPHLWVNREMVVNTALKLTRECTYRPFGHKEPHFQWGGSLKERRGSEWVVVTMSNDVPRAKERGNDTKGDLHPVVAALPELES
ncbi:MAG: hypothetical protein Q9214_002228 [Letrouitia sp. 1 TL-2023]